MIISAWNGIIDGVSVFVFVLLVFFVFFTHIWHGLVPYCDV